MNCSLIIFAPTKEIKMLNRTVPPPIVDAVNFNLQLQPYEKFVLKNGVQVYAIDAGTEEVLMVEWVFAAGNWYEDKNLQAAVTNHLLKNGTAHKSAFEISEQVDYYGAYLSRNCHAETATVTLHTLNKHIEKLLPIVREVLTESVFPKAEVDIAIQNMKQKLDVNLKKSSFVAGRLIDQYLFGADHPYGRFSRHEDFDALTREDLLGFYNDFYKEGQLVIFVAGKLPANIALLLEQYFGDLPNRIVAAKQYTIHPDIQKKHHVINDPNSNQGSVRLARPFPNRHHPDFLKAQMLNIVFGGYFGSRLMTNIREEKGYTYGIHSYLMPNMHDNGWMISTEAGREVSEAAVAEVYKEMDILRNELIDEEELLLVKNYMMGSILGDLEGPFQIIGRWKNSILNGLDDGYFERAVDNVKTISAETLLETAQQYLKPEDFYELIVY